MWGRVVERLKPEPSITDSDIAGTECAEPRLSFGSAGRAMDTATTKGSIMGTYQREATARIEAARIEAACLNVLYEQWWETLDGTERRVARSFLGFGIPEDFAHKLAAAGIPQVKGLLASAAGTIKVWLPRTILTNFVARHPVGC